MYCDDCVTNLVLGGFGGSQKAYKELCATVKTETGEATLFVPSARWRGMFIRNTSKIPKVFFRQATLIAQMLRQKKIRRIRLIDHSLGGAEGMAFTILFAAEFEIVEVISLNSACVTREGVDRLVPKIVKMFFDDLKNEKGKRYWRNSLWYFSNPVRCLMEAWAAGETVLIDQFETRVGEISYAFKDFFGYSLHDTVFDWADMENALEGRGSIRVIVPGKHDSQNYAKETVAALVKAGAFQSNAPERS